MMDEALAMLLEAVDSLDGAITRLKKAGVNVTELQALYEKLNDRLIELEDSGQ